MHMKGTPPWHFTHGMHSPPPAPHKVHRPGIEPGPHRWQRCILPLDHRCCYKWRSTTSWSCGALGRMAGGDSGSLSAPHPHGKSTRIGQHCQWAAGVSLPPPQASGSWAHSHLCCPSGVPREHNSQGPGHLGVLRLPEPRTPLAQVCECIGRESNPGHIDGNNVFYH